MLTEEMTAVLDSVDELIIRREYEVALRLMEENESAFLDTTDRHRTAEFLLRRAELVLPEYRWDEASGILKEVYQHYTQAHMGDADADLLMRRILTSQGIILARQGNFVDAGEKFEQGLKLGPKRDVRRAMLLNSYASMLGERGDLDKAIGYYTQAISILESIGEEYELSRANNNLADALYNTGDYEGTVDNARRCILLAERTVNTRLLGFGYMTGGEALVKIGETDEARKFHEKAVKVFEGDTDDDYVQGCLFLLQGMVETGAGNYKEAKKAFDRGEKLLRSLDIPFYDAKVTFESALCYKKTGNYAEARKRYTHALEIFRELRAKTMIKESKAHLADIAKAIG